VNITFPRPQRFCISNVRLGINNKQKAIFQVDSFSLSHVCVNYHWKIVITAEAQGDMRETKNDE
jgi:hypothetical protein